MCVPVQVCLSLLNTWQGRGTEVWDPKSSSVLQVGVSHNQHPDPDSLQVVTAIALVGRI